MGMRAAVVVLVVGVVGGVASTPQDDIILDATGYKGVTVAISDQLDKNKCKEYVNGIKDMVAAASQLMFTATGNMVFFGDVVIVVPQDWVCQGIALTTNQKIYSWNSAHIRVGPSHYLFGDNPWTQQLGGCGEPGDWIYLSENFLMSNTNAGSPGNILVHEWAKYRWGVFEEYGHAHDPIFPSGYRNESNIITPTYCTDHLLEGTMSCPEGWSEVECQFTPELSQNSTVTSSLLAAPFLDSVINFCDNSSHNPALPTKHNLLCDQISTKDVIARHSDMERIPVSWTNTSFTVVHAKPDGPRMVLLVEYSAIMGLHSQDDGSMVIGRWEQLRDNVRQFIKKEAAADSYLGVVVFGNRIVNASNILPLSQEKNRQDLASYLPEIPNGATGQRDLNMAIQRGVEVLGEQGGTLVLLTHNLKAYTGSLNLVETAANNPVWPILYPSNNSVPTEIFQNLASISPDTSVLTIDNGLFIFGEYEYQSVDTSANLHYNLLRSTASPATRVASGSCNKKICTIALEMKNITLYTSEAYVIVFYSQADVNSYFQVAVTDPNNSNIAGIKDEAGTMTQFPVSRLQNGQYVVSVSNSQQTVIVAAELWASPAPALQVSVWSPTGLHNLLYSPGSAPRLLAKVTNSASWPVLFADITAVVSSETNLGKPVTITLNDGGTGGDVTGQDGVYSGYLVGFQPNMDITVTFTVTDNNGTAQVVNTSLKAAPTTQESITCCGSQLDVSNLQLESTGRFAFSSSAVSGRLTGVSNETLPPGRVMDLQASRNGFDVTLTFTAPGAQLDQGKADWYAVDGVGEELPIYNISGVPAGSTVTGHVTLQNCDKVYTLTVVAYFNGVNGSPSNSVREIVSCASGSNNSHLTPGAIAGITIGCILGVLLLVLIIYLCLNRDHLDDLWVWKMLTCRTCRCCKSNKEDDLYNPPSQARRSDVIRSNSRPSKPVRDLTDLYSRPNMGTKREEKRQDRAQDEDDGGFGERQKRQNNILMKAADDVESVASSRSTLPINQVGLPIGDDNHAYDDGPYTIYRNAPPVPTHPRANTQV